MEFKKNGTASLNHLEDIKAIIVQQTHLIDQYKITIGELREDREQLKEEVITLKNENKEITNKLMSQVGKTITYPPAKKKKLSKREKLVYDIYLNNEVKSLDQLDKLSEMPRDHINVYRSKIRAKGYSMDFEY